jgi:6-pyruvoyltetrahydropterin/6-carboxytetrahydropterin synthase
MTVIRKASRFHDFSYGHRVVGHENKCRDRHGHNGRVHFHCAAAQLDQLGRVIDFGVINSLLCQWVERYWDHKFLMWEQDPMLEGMLALGSDDIVITPFNPTAEQMASYLLEVVGPAALEGTGVMLVAVELDETRKCSASAEIIA